MTTTNYTRGLVVIRSSQGTESDVGLEQQRETLPELAKGEVDHVDIIDLGIHTGFSRLSQDRLPLKEKFIDQHEEYLSALELVQMGVYDYIFAWDDTRLARDEYIHIIQHNALQGNAEFRFVEEVPDNDMVYAIKRVVELHVKLNELWKSQKAKQRRQEEGLPDGRPPLGLTYNGDKTALIPGDADEYDTALKIIRLNNDGESQRGIARQVGPSRSTVRRVLENRDLYQMEVSGDSK